MQSYEEKEMKQTAVKKLCRLVRSTYVHQIGAMPVVKRRGLGIPIVLRRLSVYQLVIRHQLGECREPNQFHTTTLNLTKYCPKMYYNESVSDESHCYKSWSLLPSSRNTEILKIKDVSNLRLQLSHGANIALTNYIRFDCVWESHMERKIDDINQNRKCSSSFNANSRFKLQLILRRCTQRLTTALI